MSGSKKAQARNGNGVAYESRAFLSGRVND
jgi:hypothetical protein